MQAGPGARRRAVAARRPSKAGDEWESAWTIGLDRVVRDLEELNGSTERDFLAVGERLMEFRSTARQISQAMAALTELLSSAHDSHTSDALRGVLEYARELDVRSVRSSEALAKVCGLSSQIRHSLSGLRELVQVFRTLCTLTRIETSRLGASGADFGDLTAEVKPLSESIQATGEGLLAACAQLDLGVQAAQSNGQELRDRHLSELPVLMASLIDGLQAFQDRQQLAMAGSGRHAAQYEALSQALEGVVRAVQCHDLTRQQIEHVVQALSQLRASGTQRGADPGGLPAEGRAILSVQLSQLARATAMFASSMDSMERDLASIAGRVENTAAESLALTGDGSAAQGSFFLRMESQFTAILKLLGTCTTGQEEMAATACGLAETIDRMRSWVNEIRAVEIRIQRIAINAAIRSTHIGEAGNALNVIAEVMQRLAAESNRNTEEVGVALETMSEAAGCVSSGVVTASSAGLNANQAVEEMRQALVELHSSSERSYSRVQEIVSAGARLAKDILAVRLGLTAGPLFVRVSAGARGEMERMLAQSAAPDAGSVDSAAATQLDGLASYYTMQIERDVHQAATGGAATGHAFPGNDPPGDDICNNDEPLAPVAAYVAAYDGEDLGDNIELF